MTGVGCPLEPESGLGPPVLTSDAAVRDALACYLGAVAQRLSHDGHRVSGPILAPPQERLAGIIALPAPPAAGTARAVWLVAGWNEETGWSTRRDPPDQPDRPGGGRRYLHLGLIPAPVIAAQFITDALTGAGGGGGDRAAPNYPAQFRYRTGRAGHLLARLTCAT